MIIKRLQLFFFLLLITAVFGDDEIAKDIKVNETYLQVADYVAQSPKYGAFARDPGSYDNAKAKAQAYIDSLRFGNQELINEAKAAGYEGRGSHLVNADYILDNYEDFQTTFKHLVDNCINDNYTLPVEFRFDTVGFRNDKSAYKIQCFEHYELYRLSVFPNMGLCYNVSMTEIFNGISYHLGTVYDRAECKVSLGNDTIDGKGEILYFRSEKLGELTENKIVNNTLVDFIMKNDTWKTKLGIVDKSGAYDYVETMFAGEIIYKQIEAEYKYWYTTEKRVYIEYNLERGTPFNPTLTNKTTNGENGFIALTSESSAGFLSLQMEWALKTGDIVVGYFKTIEPLAQWNYAIIATDGKIDGEKPEDFLKNNLNESNKKEKKIIEGKLTDTYVMRSIITGIAYRKKGTCIVRIQANDKIFAGRPENSPQFDNKKGKDLIPVHYRSDFLPAGQEPHH